MKNPVLLICYNRQDLVETVIGRIRKYAPKRLYLASDGGKNEEDWLAVARVREYLDHAIDWECQVFTRFSEINQGCKYGPYNAINWFFENEEQGIILEDDIVPGPDFWRFCDELLEYYKTEEKVLVISGCNEIDNFDTQDSYVFSKYPSYWGWATWKRAWNLMDIDMKALPGLVKENYFKKNFRRDTAVSLQRTFLEIQERNADAWDYQWMLAGILSGGMGAVPRQSLVENQGIGRDDGTHTTSEFLHFTMGKLDAQIIHPQNVQVTWKYEMQYEKTCYRINHLNEFIKNHFPKPIVERLKKIYWDIKKGNKT